MTYNDWLSHTSVIPLFFILNIKIKTKCFSAKLASERTIESK